MTGGQRHAEQGDADSARQTALGRVGAVGWHEAYILSVADCWCLPVCQPGFKKVSEKIKNIFSRVESA
jgi:hypothetical protein